MDTTQLDLHLRVLNTIRLISSKQTRQYNNECKPSLTLWLRFWGSKTGRLQAKTLAARTSFKSWCAQAAWAKAWERYSGGGSFVR